MKKKYREEIKTVFDYNEVVMDILDCWLEDFVLRDGLTRDPTEDDLEEFADMDIGWIYTQKGMKLYNRACKRYRDLGKKLFPENEHELDIKAAGMLFP
jgi:hypothetical protein